MFFWFVRRVFGYILLFVSVFSASMRSTHSQSHVLTHYPFNLALGRIIISFIIFFVFVLFFFIIHRCYIFFILAMSFDDVVGDCMRFVGLPLLFIITFLFFSHSTFSMLFVSLVSSTILLHRRMRFFLSLLVHSLLLNKL